MYKLDVASAKQSDTFTSKYLSESGKYVGTFVRAERLISSKKTEGVGFTFKVKDTEQTCKFDMWVMNGAGVQLPSYHHLMAIMTCLKIKELNPQKGIVSKYVYDLKKEVEVESEVFNDLLNKEIGLVLRNVEYEKYKDGYATGETGWKLEPYAIFSSENELTASEILDKQTSPKKLAQAVASLSDKPLKNRLEANIKVTKNFESTILDDDIPF